MIPSTKKGAQPDYEEVERKGKIEAKKEALISLTSATKCSSAGKIAKSGKQFRIDH